MRAVGGPRLSSIEQSGEDHRSVCQGLFWAFRPKSSKTFPETGICPTGTAQAMVYLIVNVSFGDRKKKSAEVGKIVHFLSSSTINVG